jgi:hypothetical protein
MGVCQQLEARRSQLPTELPGKGTGHSRGRRETRILRGIASDETAGCSVSGAGRYYEVSSARGLRLAIISSFRAACWGLRVPCSQLRTAFVLTLR